MMITTFNGNEIITFLAGATVAVAVLKAIIAQLLVVVAPALHMVATFSWFVFIQEISTSSSSSSSSSRR